MKPSLQWRISIEAPSELYFNHNCIIHTSVVLLPPLHIIYFSLRTQSQMWSGISQQTTSQHHLCFWYGLNHLEIDLSLKLTGLVRNWTWTEMQQKLWTLPITSLVWLLESITHSASLLWQQINQQKEKLSASQTIPVCKTIKYLFCATQYIIIIIPFCNS